MFLVTSKEGREKCFYDSGLKFIQDHFYSALLVEALSVQWEGNRTSSYVEVPKSHRRTAGVVALGSVICCRPIGWMNTKFAIV